MLRLEGMSFARGEAQVPSGFVRFGDVTVLSGPNDSGKTKLLQLLKRALNGPVDLPRFRGVRLSLS
jgi:ABC-type cobalamin/Fe3+-siderophores transport system ATPase subunit